MIARAPGPAARLLSREADWGRAPSAHNTQPWLVRAVGTEALALGWHADRVLEVGDPTRRDLLLSLGCVAEALAICAADLGYAASVRWEVDRRLRHAARLTLVTQPPRAAGGLDVSLLGARRTGRGRYLESPVSVEQVREVAAAAGLPEGVALPVLPGPLVEEALRAADRWTFEGPASAELREWLRLRPGHPRYHLDGLTDRALGLGRWEAAVLAAALRPGPLAVLRVTGLTRALAASSTARPLGRVLALTAPQGLDDDRVGDLGRSLLRTWLVAARLGLVSHPLSQLLDCPVSAERLAGHLGPGRAAYAVFRLGRPIGLPPRSARITG